MATKPDDPIDRDAWLQQALRHAPDADAAPPAAVREAILARAREAGSATTPARRAGAFETLLAWIARPPVAAGFATLAMSTVLVTLWWGGSLDDGTDPRPQATRRAPDVSERAPGVSETVPQAAPPAPARQAAEPEPARPAASPEPAERARQSAAGARARPPAAPAATPDHAAPAAAAERAVPTITAEQAAPTQQTPTPPEPPPASLPPPQTAPAAPPAPPAATAATADGAARLESQRAAPSTPAGPSAAPPAAAADRRLGGSLFKAAPEPRLRSEVLERDATTAPTATSRARLSSAPQPADPLQPILRALSDPGADLRWTWAGRPHAHDAVRQAWFDTLRAATRGRWQASAPAPDAAGASMQLLDGTRIRAEWRIADDRVLLTDPLQGSWQATLDAADAARLRRLADGW